MCYIRYKKQKDNQRDSSKLFSLREKKREFGGCKTVLQSNKKADRHTFFYVGIRDKIDRREVFDSFCFILVFIAFYWKQKKKTFRKVTNLDKNRMIDLSFGWYFELRE